jgi:hypothetical protein
MEKKDDIKQTGLNISNITFDQNGEVAGLEGVALDDAALDDVSAGSNSGGCINVFCAEA